MTLTLDLDDETLTRLEAQARALGIDDTREYVRQVLHERAFAASGRDADAYLDDVAGSLSTGRSTEQMMDDTRSEV